MKFFIQERTKKQNTSLLYGDYWFYMEPYDKYGFTSILVNDIELNVNDEGRITDVCGYCPLIEYKETNEFPEDYKNYSLIVILDNLPVPGASVRLTDVKGWPMYINKKKGWVCIGNPDTENKQLIEFVPHCVATMEGQELIAVWLHPQKLPPLDH